MAVVFLLLVVIFWLLGWFFVVILWLLRWLLRWLGWFLVVIFLLAFFWLLGWLWLLPFTLVFVVVLVVAVTPEVFYPFTTLDSFLKSAIVVTTTLDLNIDLSIHFALCCFDLPPSWLMRALLLQEDRQCMLTSSLFGSCKWKRVVQIEILYIDSLMIYADSLSIIVGFKCNHLPYLGIRRNEACLTRICAFILTNIVRDLHSCLLLRNNCVYYLILKIGFSYNDDMHSHDHDQLM